MTTEKRNSIMGWHNEKKIIIGLITAVLINMSMSIWQSIFVISSLDTDPPVIQRIIKLEFHASEQGRVNQKILDEIAAARQERERFREEQSKRTTTVYDAGKHMRDRRIHK